MKREKNRNNYRAWIDTLNIIERWTGCDCSSTDWLTLAMVKFECARYKAWTTMTMMMIAIGLVFGKCDKRKATAQNAKWMNSHARTLHHGLLFSFFLLTTTTTIIIIITVINAICICKNHHLHRMQAFHANTKKMLNAVVTVCCFVARLFLLPFTLGSYRFCRFIERISSASSGRVLLYCNAECIWELIIL